MTLPGLTASIGKGAEQGRSVSVHAVQESAPAKMTNPIAKLSFWGVRGSTPTVDPATWRYGGNTPCLELVAPDGSQIILDCGTGLRTLGSRWGNGGGEAGHPTAIPPSPILSIKMIAARARPSCVAFNRFLRVATRSPRQRIWPHLEVHDLG